MNSMIRYKFLLVLTLGGLLMLTTGCQKDSGNSSPAPAATPYPYNVGPYGNNGYPPNGYNNGYATTPQPCSHNSYYPNQSTCQQFYTQFSNYYPNWSSTYSNYSWNHGAWYWPTQVNHLSGYCGCPSGYTPVYGSTFGVSCAPNAYFNHSTVIWVNIGYSWGQPQNQQWLNNPQVQYNGNNPGCNQVAQGCDVRMNNCQSGYTCRPVAGGSTIGLCAL